MICKKGGKNGVKRKKLKENLYDCRCQRKKNEHRDKSGVDIMN
jgi:hypothetical protein